MNRISQRIQNNGPVPLTPNLQQYKLHGKTKAKKKNLCPSIQPTIQPIQLSDKSPTTPTNFTNKMTICQYHPDRKAIYFTRDNNKKPFCGICAVTDGGGDSKFLDQQKYEKAQSIQIFKKRVNTFFESLITKQKQIEFIMKNEQSSYTQYFANLRSTFQSLINQIEEKQSQLSNALLDSIQKRKQSLNQTAQLMKQIKKSIERYIYDINKNYEQILADLSIDNFRDIMKQYNAKVQYYSENANKKIKKLESQTINIYLPVMEIRRALEKANVQYICFENERIGTTRSIEKLISSGCGKENMKNMRMDRQERVERQDRKSESKFQNSKKESGNRIHHIRGANKQNNYFEGFYNSQNSDQKGYPFD